ncbi:MAG: TRZ/ATZ family protein, partial [Calditrichaeota bacterium]
MTSFSHLSTPLSKSDIHSLHAGDMVEISGILYTARDAAHRRFAEALKKGQSLPFELLGNIIFYAGPAPTRPGKIIGSVGPTTSMRMNDTAPLLIAAGLGGIIGKGELGGETSRALQQHGAVYFAAIGGAAAKLAQAVKTSRVIAYEDLGAEAVYELRVESFIVIVAQDSYAG